MFKINTFFFIVFLITFFHCKQPNQLAQDELTVIKELSALEAIVEQEVKGDRLGKYLNIPEKPRIADPANPLVILDILKARSDVREVKLSELYSRVNYIPIKITPPKDSLFATFDFNNCKFLVTPNNILVSDYSRGIYQYDRSGEFVATIVENDFYYTATPNRKSFMVSKEDRQQFVGSSGKIHAIGDVIYYQYHDNPEQKSDMFMYDASPGVLSQITVGPTKENLKNSAQGIPLFSLPNEDRSIMVNFLGTNDIFPLNEDTWASSFGVTAASKSGSFLVSTNIMGDTLTKFQNHDPVKNYIAGQFRAVDGNGTQYSFEGIQHIRQPHNDTIYALLGNDQLAPKYVLNFGDKGIQSTLEGISVKTDMKHKFIIHNFIETSDYLFIVYTQNAPSPNSAKKGLLFSNTCIYDKHEKALFHVFIDKKPFIPPGKSWPRIPKDDIKNNIDHGPAFWPENITPDGFPFVALQVSDLKSKVNLWQGNGAMIENLNKMKNTDFLLMIVQ